MFWFRKLFFTILFNITLFAIQPSHAGCHIPILWETSEGTDRYDVQADGSKKFVKCGFFSAHAECVQTGQLQSILEARRAKLNAEAANFYELPPVTYSGVPKDYNGTSMGGYVMFCHRAKGVCENTCPATEVKEQINCSEGPKAEVGFTDPFTWVYSGEGGEYADTITEPASGRSAVNLKVVLKDADAFKKTKVTTTTTYTRLDDCTCKSDVNIKSEELANHVTDDDVDIKKLIFGIKEGNASLVKSPEDPLKYILTPDPGYNGIIKLIAHYDDSNDSCEGSKSADISREIQSTSINLKGPNSPIQFDDPLLLSETYKEFEIKLESFNESWKSRFLRLGKLVTDNFTLSDISSVFKGTERGIAIFKKPIMMKMDKFFEEHKNVGPCISDFAKNAVKFQTSDVVGTDEGKLLTNTANIIDVSKVSVDCLKALTKLNDIKSKHLDLLATDLQYLTYIKTIKAIVEDFKRSKQGVQDAADDYHKILLLVDALSNRVKNPQKRFNIIVNNPTGAPIESHIYENPINKMYSADPRPQFGSCKEMFHFAVGQGGGGTRVLLTGLGVKDNSLQVIGTGNIGTSQIAVDIFGPQGDKLNVFIGTLKVDAIAQGLTLEEALARVYTLQVATSSLMDTLQDSINLMLKAIEDTSLKITNAMIDEEKKIHEKLLTPDAARDSNFRRKNQLRIDKLNGPAKVELESLKNLKNFFKKLKVSLLLTTNGLIGAKQIWDFYKFSKLEDSIYDYYPSGSIACKTPVRPKPLYDPPPGAIMGGF